MEDSCVLVTSLASDRGVLQITDCLTPRSGADLVGPVPASRGSAPVRWGNGAIHQLQHDVYGEIIDIAYQWSNSGGRVDGRLWAALTPIVELAIQQWKTPDSGPWEIRAQGRPFTY